MKKALILGITGQDGSYLAEFLFGKGYEVFGIIRRSSTFNTSRIDHINHDRHEGVYQGPHDEVSHNSEVKQKLNLFFGDLNDTSSLERILRIARPDEIYNLGAQSHVKVSFEIPGYTAEVTGLGTLRLLEAIRETGLNPKFYQASSSELYGIAKEAPQTEKTPFYPRSPYACAKAFAFHTSVNYREAYGIYACNGILFNHESPRRGETFVSRKITRAATRIRVGLQKKLYLGNLEAKRDWGYAPEYVEAMWLMLQHEKPDDYVIATGECHTVQEFVEESFSLLGLDWKKYVEIDPSYMRPTETGPLVGNASKARKQLGWEAKVRFHELVRIMVAADLELAKREAHMNRYLDEDPIQIQATTSH